MLSKGNSIFISWVPNKSPFQIQLTSSIRERPLRTTWASDDVARSGRSQTNAVICNWKWLKCSKRPLLEKVVWSCLPYISATFLKNFPHPITSGPRSKTWSPLATRSRRYERFLKNIASLIDNGQYSLHAQNVDCCLWLKTIHSFTEWYFCSCIFRRKESKLLIRVRWSAFSALHSRSNSWTQFLKHGHLPHV